MTDGGVADSVPIRKALHDGVKRTMELIEDLERRGHGYEYAKDIFEKTADFAAWKGEK